MAYLVCLDTNILSDLVRKIEAGESPKWWADLRGLVEAGQATMLVPEITLLELETVIRDTDDKIARELAQLPGKVSERSVKEHLKKDPLKDWRTKMVKGWKTEAEKVEKFLRAKPEHVIEYTAEIAHRTKKRLIAGRHPRPPLDEPMSQNEPYKKWLREQDCGIIESLASWFVGKKLDDSILAFGTKDGEKGDGGFGVVEDGNGSLDKKKFEKGVGILDETFADGLPPSQLFFQDMEKLVKFVEKEEKPKTLSPEEQAIVQELKLKQEAVAGVLTPGSGGGTTIQIVVGDTSGAHDHPPSVSVNAIGGYRVMPGMRLAGFQHGPYLVEPAPDDQAFFDMSNVPQPQKFPVEGLQNFDASNLGDDDPQKPKDEKSGEE